MSSLIVYKRTQDSFERIVMDQPASIIELKNPDVMLRFSDIYRDVEFKAT